jgi:peptidoglycan/xylan/chitin deacetylase (PgdA/CDA1 family)
MAPVAQRGAATAAGRVALVAGAARLRLQTTLAHSAQPVALAALLGLALLLGATAPTRGAAGPNQPGAGAPQPSGNGTGQQPAGAPPGSAHAEPAPPPGGSLYRIVGCSSRGGAYLHGPSLREVAIGFDDGPAPDTGAFVTMLERAGVRATFFMIGRQVSSVYRPVMVRELRNGDVLGDHTFTHPDLVTSGDVRGQLQSTLAAIRALSGYTPCVFRPPYGDYDASVVGTARSLGLATVGWNVDPRDWALPGTAAIVRTVLDEVAPGSIIISHDGGGPRGQTLAAYPTIIKDLRARRYRIVTIPELLGFRPVYRACVKLCDGLGEPRSALPRDAILERAP